MCKGPDSQLCHYRALQTLEWVGLSLNGGLREGVKSMPKGTTYHSTVDCIEPPVQGLYSLVYRCNRLKCPTLDSPSVLQCYNMGHKSRNKPVWSPSSNAITRVISRGINLVWSHYDPYGQFTCRRTILPRTFEPITPGRKIEVMHNEF